jgi:hypothetical protein
LLLALLECLLRLPFRLLERLPLLPHGLLALGALLLQPLGGLLLPLALRLLPGLLPLIQLPLRLLLLLRKLLRRLLLLLLKILFLAFEGLLLRLALFLERLLPFLPPLAEALRGILLFLAEVLFLLPLRLRMFLRFGAALFHYRALLLPQPLDLRLPFFFQRLFVFALCLREVARLVPVLLFVHLLKEALLPLKRLLGALKLLLHELPFLPQELLLAVFPLLEALLLRLLALAELLLLLLLPLAECPRRLLFAGGLRARFHGAEKEGAAQQRSRAGYIAGALSGLLVLDRHLSILSQLPLKSINGAYAPHFSLKCKSLPNRRLATDSINAYAVCRSIAERGLRRCRLST